MAGGLRIIGGELKGVALYSPPVGITRPLRSIVKKSMFDVIGADITDASCLDLFAGSGSIGLEAVSRGACSCVFVESDPEVFSILQKNVDKIRRYVDNSEVRLRVVKADVGVFLTAVPVDSAPFGFIFLDPPFTAQAIAERCLGLLAAEAGWMASGGSVFYQFRGKSDIKQNDWRVIDRRTFGDSVVVRLMRIVDL